VLLSKGSVLGIDVGCSPTSKTSAVCRLDWDETTVSWTIQRFRAVEPERTETISRHSSVRFAPRTEVVVLPTPVVSSR
jgi:hypothetical protein